jgi:hypothetical protein
MITKRITYTDYLGQKRTEDFSFNISKAESAELELSVDGGLSELLRRIIKAEDKYALIKEFKKVLVLSYGVISPDGRRFIKSKELTDSFIQTEAYSNLFMELATDDKAAAEFVNGILASVNENDKSTRQG